jgi:hypothetical protein
MSSGEKNNKSRLKTYGVFSHHFYPMYEKDIWMHTYIWGKMFLFFYGHGSKFNGSIIFCFRILRSSFRPGLPDFSWYRKPKMKKITKLTTKCTKRPLNTPNGLKIPNGHKMYQNLPFQGLKSYA